MKSPIEGFFSLGNRVTKGDPLNKARFDYYLYWILALAFFFLMCNYIYLYYQSGFTHHMYLAWGLVMLVITWFNYHTLGSFYGVYTNLSRVYDTLGNKTNKKVEKIESESSIKDMMGEFK